MTPSLPDSTVYLITHEFYPKRGGIATFAEEMARASAELGMDVEVWAQNATGAEEKSWPFRIWRLPLKGTHDLTCQLRLAFQLVRRRRELRRATVFLPEPGPMLTLMLLQRFNAFRPRNLVLTFHGSEILKFHRNPLVRPMARRLIQYASRISVLSEYTRDLLITHFPTAAPKIILTPGALRSDFEVIDTQSPFAGSTGSARTVVLTVGRIHPRKGQLETLNGLRALAPHFREKIEYWLVGSGNKTRYAKELKEAADSCDFPVKFLGDISDEELGPIYERADIFAMTSLDHGKSVEGFGLVYLEASAHGLPVIGHRVGGVPEAVIDGKTGLLVSPEHPEQLPAAFAKLIENPNLRREFGQAGRSWARQNNWADSARVLFSSDAAASGNSPDGS